jgi:uncharacterized protein (DUF736 family)
VVKIGGWKRQDNQGKTYLSLRVDRFVPEQQGQVRAQPRQEDDLDSDVPF